MGYNYTAVLTKVEQLRDIWCGRVTYSNEKDWLDNVDAAMHELAEATGLSFTSAKLKRRRR